MSHQSTQYSRDNYRTHVVGKEASDLLFELAKRDGVSMRQKLDDLIHAAARSELAGEREKETVGG